MGRDVKAPTTTEAAADAQEDPLDVIPAAPPGPSAETSSSPPKAPGKCPSEEALYRSAARKASWCLLPVLLPVVVINYMDRSALSFTGSALIAYLGISETTYGVVGGLFYIPYCLLQLPSLWVAQFVSVRLWLCALTLLWGATTFLTAFVTAGWQLGLARIMLGVSEAGCFPLIYYYLDLFYSPRDFALILSSAIGTSLAFSSVIAAPFATLILSTLNGVGGFMGWQWLYFLLGGLAMLTGLLIAVALIDPPGETTIFTREEANMVKRMKFKFTSLDDNSKADLLAASRDWRSIYLGVLALLFNGTFITFFLFTPLIIESLLELVGIPEGDTYIYSVALTTIPALFTVIFLGLTGTFLRAAPSTWRWPFGAIDLCLTVLLYAALPASYNSGNFLLGLFTYSFLAGLSSPVMAVVDVFPSLYLQKNGASSSYFSVLNSIKQLSSIWTPAVIGSLIPVLGAAQAVTVVGLAYTIPGALMFTGWFYLIGKDEPIAGHKRSSAKDSADAL